MYNPFQEPFLQENLNPLFLEEIGIYWGAFKDVEEDDQVKLAKHNLLRFAFRKLLASYYLKKPEKIAGSIFFMSCISSDGLGDYFSLHKAASAFKEAHQDLDIQIAYTHERDLPLLNPKERSFLQRPGTRLLEGVLEGKNFTNFSQELAFLKKEVLETANDYEIVNRKNSLAGEALKDLLDEQKKRIKELEEDEREYQKAQLLYIDLKKSLAIVHIALALNTFENPDFSSKSLYFSETGNFQGIGNALNLNWYSMGLDPFEEGIYLKGRNGSKVLEDLYLCYITKTPKLIEIYLYLVCLQEQDETKNIDVYLMQQIDFALEREFLESIGIGIVEKITADGRQEIKINENPKRLRLHCKLPVAQAEFFKLLKSSRSPLGCTGDLSFSECLMEGKLPFYEARSHKIETLQAIIRITSSLKLESLKKYFTGLASFEAKTSVDSALFFYEILKENTFDLEWKKFLDFIRKYYCFENNLTGHLNRFLAYQNNPDLKKKEDLCIRSIANRQTSAQASLKLFFS